MVSANQAHEADDLRNEAGMAAEKLIVFRRCDAA
jgi:hypothetical protein